MTRCIKISNNNLTNFENEYLINLITYENLKIKIIMLQIVCLNIQLQICNHNSQNVYQTII